MSLRILVRTTSTELDDERLPDRTKDGYAIYMRWEGISQREQLNPKRQAGEPLHIIRTGSAEDWNLMKGSLVWHILELRSEFEGERFPWIEAWDEPQDSD
ncbi:hypothetical protein ACFLS0_05325 [Candidatus Bipolaricaulota bacterium]